MNTDDFTDEFAVENQWTEMTIGCAMRVSRELGVGFLEKVYENALCVELSRADVLFERQKPLQIFYRGVCVGDYIADLVVGNCVIIELKSAPSIEEFHKAQLLNYLRATNSRVGLILNFGTSRLGIKRMVL